MRLAQRLRDLGLGVRGVEDVPVEVAADRDRAQRDVRQVDERLRRQVRLRDGVVLELEIRRELHQERPVGTRPRAHPLDHRPSRRSTPRSAPSAQTTKVAASSSQW